MYYGNPKNRTIRDVQPYCCTCGKVLTTKEQLDVCYKNPRNNYYSGEPLHWRYHTCFDKWIYKCDNCGTKQIVKMRIKSTPMEK